MDASEWVFALISLGVRGETAASWSHAFESEVRPDAFSAGESEIDDFLAQILHESAMLERTEENLNYTTPERLQAVWPARFIELDDALPFVKNPIRIAERVYMGRMGNTESGDGWKYRGRGLIMVTGRKNYRMVSDILGVNMEESPDLLAQKVWALRTAIAWWEKSIPDVAMGDVQRITKLVNGGTNGLAHRVALAEAAKDIV